MANLISTSLLQGYLNRLIAANSLSDFGKKTEIINKVYTDLSNAGFGYANLANGLVKGDTFSGNVAVNFLSNAATASGKPLSGSQTTTIELQMAQGYVQTLLNNANANGGSISSEITYQQALNFHSQVFAANGLPASAWTLYAPGQVLGSNIMQSLWSCLVNSSAVISNIGSTALFELMSGEALLGNASAQSWSSNVVQAGFPAIVSTMQNSLLGALPTQNGTLFYSTNPSWSALNGGIYVPATPPAVPTNLAATQPANASTRNSLSFIAGNGANSMVIGSGGTVWDVYVAQKTNANGFSNWTDFQAAVSVCNPNITNLNNVVAGQTIYLPQKMADGSITYHYQNGASINTNASTGAYSMLIPDGSGGTISYVGTNHVDGSAVSTTTRQNAQGLTTSVLVGDGQADGSSVVEENGYVPGATTPQYTIRTVTSVEGAQTIVVTGTGAAVGNSDASITLDNNASATLTGTGNTVNSTNSQITLGDDASATVTGSGNTITVGAGASLTVNSGSGSNAINGANHYANQNPANDWHWLSDMLINTVAA